MPEGAQYDLPAWLIFGITTLLFGSSVLAWIVWMARGTKRSAQPGAPLGAPPLAAWDIGWVNFGIFLCSLIVGSTFIQLFAASLLSPHVAPETEQGPPSAWALAAGALIVQSSFIAIYWAFRRFMPEAYAGVLNTRVLPLWAVIRRTAPLFLRGLLIIGLVSVVWRKLLDFAVAQEWVAPFQPQEAVLVFTRGEDPIALTCLALVAVILAPIAEEIIFRGCIYRFLKSQMGLYSAMLASSCLFGVIHFNLLALGPLICVGFLLAYVYEKERNLLVPICFHAAFNCLTLTITTLQALSTVEFPQ